MISPGRVFVSIFGFDIMWYGALIGFAFVLCACIAYKRAPKHGLESDFVSDILLTVIPCAIIGARAYYVLFEWERYRGDLNAILNFRGGGLAIHGGIILSAIGLYCLTKIKKISFTSVLDLLAVEMPLGQAIGRWGNFFNEEAHGIETDLPWAQIIDGVGYHPTFLYESLWCFMLFIFLIWFDDHRRSFDGQIISLYMVLYSVERFFVEGLRTDSLMIGNLRQAQILSLAIIAVGSILYFVLKKKSESKDILEQEEKSSAKDKPIQEVGLDQEDNPDEKEKPEEEEKPDEKEKLEQEDIFEHED